MKKYANNKQPYLPPMMKVVEFHIERGFIGSNEPDELMLDHLFGSQESQVEYSEATESNGWCPNFD